MKFKVLNAAILTPLLAGSMLGSPILANESANFFESDCMEDQILLEKAGETFEVGPLKFKILNDEKSVSVSSKVAFYYEDLSVKGCLNIPATVSYGGQTFKVTEIASNAFKPFKLMTSVTIPNGITVIGDSAFFETGLTEVSIPGNVSVIGSSAFQNCTSLKKVNLSNGIEMIKSKAFAGCISLEQITLPDSVIVCEGSVFSHNISLKSVSFSKSLSSISSYVCEECSSLTSVSIPGNVRKIVYGAFYNCPLQNVYFGGSRNDWDTIEIGYSNSPLESCYKEENGKQIHYASESPVTPVNPGENSTTEAMYRLYNPNSGEHFYTADENEKTQLVRIGWNSEGTAWTSPKKSNTPVYRLYNPNAGDHHYTTSKSERDSLTRIGWKYEGIGWYSDDTKGVAVYREYNPNAKTGSHNYTTNYDEHRKLISIGWKNEGTAWYGMK